MVLRAAGLVVLALSAACGKGEVTIPGADDGGPGGDGGAGAATELSCVGKSGSRLRQLVRDHEDGSSDLVRLIDRERGMECIFMTASDGQLRCQPRVDQEQVHAGIVRYRDAACSERIGSVPAGVSPVLYREHVSEGDGCDERFLPVYSEVGAVAEIDEGDTIYVRDPEGDCATTTASAGTYHRLGAPIPADSFVAGTESWTEAGRLSIRRVDAEDGSHFCDVEGTLRDAEGDDCQLTFSEDGSMRCIPLAGAMNELFSDDECTAGLELAQTSACRPARYVSVYGEPGACFDRPQMRLIGETVTTPLFWDPGGVCEEFDHGDTSRFSLPGAVAPPDTFAEVRREYVAGGDRLERGDLVGDGIRIHRTRWRDTTLDTACNFSTAGDGVERCLPSDHSSETADTVYASTRYTDADCSVGVEVAWYRPDCRDRRPSWIRTVVGDTTVIHQVGEDHAGSFYLLDGEDCTPAPADEVHMHLGAAVDPAMFVSGVERLE